MSGHIRRRRALVLLSLALACGGLAASRVQQRVRGVERQVGPLVPVLVAKRELRAETRLRPRDLALREVPARFAPPDALASPQAAVGRRIAAPVAVGGYLTAGGLAAGGGASGGTIRRGERALEVSVTGGQALGGAAGQGSRVDVLVSSEPSDRSGRTFLALENVELLGLREGAPAEAPNPEGSGEAPIAGPRALATLRVTVRQAIYLTAAQNFAREVRLLARPPGDSRRQGRAGVGAADL